MLQGRIDIVAFEANPFFRLFGFHHFSRNLISDSISFSFLSFLLLGSMRINLMLVVLSLNSIFSSLTLKNKIKKNAIPAPNKNIKNNVKPKSLLVGLFWSFFISSAWSMLLQ